ncbi:hypothetical protein [Murimonas intestini]|uniref:Zn-finger containing protein n=1 Tax=Murimonas intestini TaxID=1337051 RepID=A0AB73T6N3_9FIRM|nr:hypothetical protein [Murimonas intestini]MCR1841376.1 hypothetical protein [Murimonas intestini]MCR1866294.1 hypothetical protein [Murimonas intestini]MCR1882589.1 hypothetical protein [Murimonas intestini]
MKERFQRFMAGRYGADQLSNTTLVVLVVLMVINMFARTFIINILVLAGLVWIYFRMFSRNCQNRYQENEKFLGLKNKVVGFFKKEKNIASQRKDFRIYTCPKCKQKIRVPKGKGKICVTCPKCKTEFIKKS